MPKVSVIIPCFNYAQYLPDAVESVMMQTYRDFEIIIINDGSTDDTREAAGRLIKKYGTCITLLNQYNQGLPASRNNGIKAASGEYILPLDADDTIEAVYLEKTVPVLDENPGVSIAFTNLKTFDINLGKVSVSDLDDYSFDALLVRNRLPVCSLFRKKAWEEVGGYKLMKGYADWEFWIALGAAGHTGKLVREPLFIYRKHGHSMLERSEAVQDELFLQIRKYHADLYGIGTLNTIIEERGSIIREQARLIKEQATFINDMHSVRGFVKRIAGAVARRITGKRPRVNAG